MAKKKVRRVVWSNMVNLAGLYSKTPIQCRLKLSGKYWDKSDNYDVSPGEIGISDQRPFSGIARFSSFSKREVELWTLGATAVLLRLRDFAEA